MAQTTTNKNVTLIQISDIKIEETLYPRKQLVWQTAYSYSQAIKSGAIFPAIKLGRYKKELYLIDGRHRIQAHITLKKTEIESTIKNYKTKQAMFIDAVRSNNIFGKPLTYEDKVKIFGTLQKYKMPNIEISGLIHIPVEAFSTLITRYNINSTNQVETLPSMVANALHEKLVTEAEAYEIAKNTPRRNLVEQSSLQQIATVIVLFENNLVPSTEKIRVSCTKLVGLLETYLATKGDAE